MQRRLPWAICCVFLGPPCEHRSICDATKKLLGCIIVWQKPLFSVSNQILYKGCARVNLQSRLEFCNFSSSLYFLFSVMRGRDNPKPPTHKFSCVKSAPCRQHTYTHPRCSGITPAKLQIICGIQSKTRRGQLHPHHQTSYKL